MRFMDIPRFERKIEIPDFDFFVRSRLNQAIVIWPEQAFSLVGIHGLAKRPGGSGRISTHPAGMVSGIEKRSAPASPNSGRLGAGR